MALGGVLPLVLVAIFILIFFHGFGSDFMRAANGGGLPAKITVPGTPFFYLSSIAVGSTFFAILVFVLYIVFWPLMTYISSLQQTRAIFALSYDGILHKAVTRGNSCGCPWLGLLTAPPMSAAVLSWAVDSPTW